MKKLEKTQVKNTVYSVDGEELQDFWDKYVIIKHLRSTYLVVRDDRDDTFRLLNIGSDGLVIVCNDDEDDDTYVEDVEFTSVEDILQYLDKTYETSADVYIVDKVSDIFKKSILEDK